MQTPPLLTDENQRLRELKLLGLLDTPPEERFDRITRLAADTFDVPIALLTLVDRERQWFKSQFGTRMTQTDRKISFCGHTIAKDMLVVEDAAHDPRFGDNPLVTGEPNIRFYAGVTLRSSNDRALGTLCLIDHAPRQFNGRQRLQLLEFGALAAAELERREATTRNTTSGLLRKILDWGNLRFPGRRKTSLLIALAAGACFALVLKAWDSSELQTHQSEVRNSVLQQSSIVRGELESKLNQKLHLTDALHGYVRANGNPAQGHFDAFAQQLADGVPAIRSLQLAPDGIVTHVWPVAGNLKALGHDLLADPGRRAAATLAIESGETWIAGPINLIQGGTALIAREPVFIGTGKSADSFWGFATILVDLPELLQEVGLRETIGDIQFALRGKDGLGESGEVFFGDAAVFSSSTILQDVTLPAGSWQLGARPINGWPETYPTRPVFLSAAVFSCLLLSVILYLLLRLPARLNDMVRERTADIEKSRRVFHSAIESLPMGFVVYDQDGGMISSNEKFREMLPCSRHLVHQGATLEDMIGFAMGAGHITSIDNRPAGEWSTADICKAIRFGSSAVELQLSSGRWVRAKEQATRDGGWVGYRDDVTELKEKEQALEHAKATAEEANRLKNEFLAVVSHEVRTPLNGVIGMLGVLQDDRSLSARQREYIETAQRSGGHLLSLLNQILDISKMEADRLELDRIPFSLRQIARESIEIVRPDAEARGLRLEMAFNGATHGLVLGDPCRLRQILLNLLGNAVKFTDSGTVSLSLEASACRDEQTAVSITVQDTGIGFDTSRLGELFQPFVQAQTGPTRSHGGTGLGLSITHKLVSLMGGTITVKSEPGAGSTFRIDLELSTSTETESDEPDNATQTGNEAAPDEEQKAPLVILVAEDSPTNQIVLQAMLESSNVRLEMVGNGKEAVEALSRFNYDLVLMDIHMPEMDGIEATRRIRQQFPHKSAMPIIALTANAMQGDREKYLDAGMDDYIAKPIDKRVLLQALRRVSRSGQTGSCS